LNIRNVFKVLFYLLPCNFTITRSAALKPNRRVRYIGTQRGAIAY